MANASPNCKRHGIAIAATSELTCHFGIWSIFDPWIDPTLQFAQGHYIPQSSRPLFLEYHFRRAVIRFFRSLAQLNQHLRSWDKFLADGGLNSANPGLVFDIPEDAGIALDSVCHYLQLIIDDLSRAIPYALAFPTLNATEPESFSTFKADVSKRPATYPKPLVDLFRELPMPNSWWHQGFARGTGMRQRTTHYTDLAFFAGTSDKPGEPMRGVVSLGAVGGPRQIADLEQFLEGLFHDFFAWLDRLEEFLIGHLSGELLKMSIPWNSLLKAPREISIDESARRSVRGRVLFLPDCA